MTTTATNLTREVFNSDANTINFCIIQKLLDVNTLTLARVISYNMSNRTCTVQQLINGLDAFSNPIPPPLQYEVPIMDIVGNGAGVEIEYAENDTVLVGFCQRDLTNIKTIWENQPDAILNKPVNPNSLRLFNLADGIVIGRVSNKPPTIKVKITRDGIDIVAGDKPINITTTGDVTTHCKDAKITATGDVIAQCVNAQITASSKTTITSPTIELNGNVIISGTATIGGQEFLTHRHAGGTLPDGNTGAVVP